MSADPRPWPLSCLDYRVESGRVHLDDGRTYPATTLEEELYALLVEAWGKIAMVRNTLRFALNDQGAACTCGSPRCPWGVMRRALAELEAGS